MHKNSEELGKRPINALLKQQSVPAAVGIMVMSIYMILDTIFVGQFVGPLAIAAITVVLPISFLISSVGMAISVGGSSIISRALGAEKEEHATQVFGNQITLTIILIVLVVSLGYIFDEELLILFGAKGAILEYALEYYHVILFGMPCMAWAMMCINVIRAEGFPKIAMNVMLLPAIANLIMDPIFIVWFEWGLEGAAWATVISYVMSASYATYFFLFGKSEFKIHWRNLMLHWKIVKEISSLGIVTLARQGAISLLAIVLNNSLFAYGGEIYVAVYGVIHRVIIFSRFPILGITQGMLPIAGYNYGAKLYPRVLETITKAIFYGTGIAIGICIVILVFREEIVLVFSDDPQLLGITPHAILVIFSVSPVIAIQLMGAAYFQAIGRAVPALLLTLSRQGFCLTPMLLILPLVFDYFTLDAIEGIWFAFPLADLLSAGITYVFLRRELRKLNSLERAD